MFEESLFKIKYFGSEYDVDKEHYNSNKDLLKFVTNSTYVNKDKLIKILNDYEETFNNSDKIYTRTSILYDYENIKLSFSDYCENYFIKNMSEDLKQEMVDFYNKDISI